MRSQLPYPCNEQGQAGLQASWSKAMFNVLATRVPTLIIDLTKGVLDFFKFPVWDLTTDFLWDLVDPTVDGVTSCGIEANAVVAEVVEQGLVAFLEGVVSSFNWSLVDDLNWVKKRRRHDGWKTILIYVNKIHTEMYNTYNW